MPDLCWILVKSRTIPKNRRENRMCGSPWVSRFSWQILACAFSIVRWIRLCLVFLVTSILLVAHSENATQYMGRRFCQSVFTLFQSTVPSCFFFVPNISKSFKNCRSRSFQNRLSFQNFPWAFISLPGFNGILQGLLCLRAKLSTNYMQR